MPDSATQLACVGEVRHASLPGDETTLQSLIEQLTEELMVPPQAMLMLQSSTDDSLNEQTARLVRAVEAGQRLMGIWEQKYYDTSAKLEMLLCQQESLKREIHQVIISRLDVEDRNEVKKAELVKKLKQETERIDRMWRQKCARLQQALTRETEQRQLLEHTLAEVPGRRRTTEDNSKRTLRINLGNNSNNNNNNNNSNQASSAPNSAPNSPSNSSSSRVNHRHSFSSTNSTTSNPRSVPMTPLSRRVVRALSQHPEVDDEEPSAAALYTAADTRVFEPPDPHSSDSAESEIDEETITTRARTSRDVKPPNNNNNNTTTKNILVEFNPHTQDALELDQFLFALLAQPSPKQNEFVAFCEVLDCGHMVRYYLKSVAFAEVARKEETFPLSQSTQELAKELYETYLRSDAQHCIQLPSALTQLPSALLAEQKVEADMFEKCQQQVRTLLRYDVLPAYITWLKGGMQKPRKDKFTIEIEQIATTNPVLVLQRWTARLGLSAVHQNYLKNELEEVLQSHMKEEETLAKFREMERELDNLNYLLSADIGSGAFGSVYRGSDRRTGEVVAIKVIDLDDVEGDIQIISREVATMKGKKCPQMTEYIDSAIYGTKLWITMEYMDGGSVLERINAWGSLKEEFIAIIVREVLYGLQFLSNENKIHRDIKAANILMRKNGAVKLADFGTSRDLSDTFAKCNTQTGSPCWMAPEVINSDASYDGKVDIWSLGITCLEMALGKAPHSELKTPMQVMRAIVEDPPPELVGDKWTPYFTKFIRKCLVKDPAQRFTIQQLLQTAFVKKAGKTTNLKKLFSPPAKSKPK